MSDQTIKEVNPVTTDRNKFSMIVGDTLTLNLGGHPMLEIKLAAIRKGHDSLTADLEVLYTAELGLK